MGCAAAGTSGRSRAEVLSGSLTLYYNWTYYRLEYTGRERPLEERPTWRTYNSFTYGYAITLNFDTNTWTTPSRRDSSTFDYSYRNEHLRATIFGGTTLTFSGGFAEREGNRLIGPFKGRVHIEPSNAYSERGENVTKPFPARNQQISVVHGEILDPEGKGLRIISPGEITG